VEEPELQAPAVAEAVVVEVQALLQLVVVLEVAADLVQLS